VSDNPVPTVGILGVPDPIPLGLHVLDVREQIEFSHGHIEGATHIPLAQIVRRLDEIPHEQTLVVCRVGARSAQAVGYLLSRGRNVVNLDGGMLDWAAAGRPMVSESGADPQVL